MKYRFLKILTILLAPFYLPLGVYIGLSLDSGDYWKSGILLGIAMVLYLGDTWIFWYLIEAQRRKEK